MIGDRFGTVKGCSGRVSLGQARRPSSPRNPQRLNDSPNPQGVWCLSVGLSAITHSFRLDRSVLS